jgi:hypothetical protein
MRARGGVVASSSQLPCSRSLHDANQALARAQGTHARSPSATGWFGEIMARIPRLIIGSIASPRMTTR